MIAISILIIIVAASFSVYVLSNYQSKVVTITDIPTVQKSDSDKLSGSTTTVTQVTKPPVEKPAPVVTPAPASKVPSLAPTSPPSSNTTTTTYQSTNWAGYLSTGGTFTAVSGTWIASSPTPTSTTKESGDGTWVGIGGITTKDLIQIGTENTFSAAGVMSTSAFYELLPAGAVGIVSVPISPGDTVSASISQQAANQWMLSITNVTTGKTFSRSVSYSSSLSSAEWIQEDPSNPDGSLVLLDNFGTVQFTNAVTTMNGTTMSAAASSASQIHLIGQGEAAGHGGTPSAINGSSFSVRYY